MRLKHPHLDANFDS